MNHLVRAWNWPREIVRTRIAALESDRVPFVASAMTFVFSLALRNYLEIFSDKADFTPAALVHFSLFYLSIALLIALVFHFATKTPILSVLKVVLPCFAVIVIAPIIDLVLSGGAGVDIAYFEPRRNDDLLTHFLFFGGPRTEPGVSWGQRVEAVLALLGCFYYVRVKGGSILRAAISVFFIYCVFFVHGALPFEIKGFLYIIGVKYRYSDELFAQVLALVVFCSGALIAYRANRTYFMAFARDFRWLRLTHYLLMFAGGLVWNRNGRPLDIHRETIFVLLLFPVSLVFASLFSIVTNNFADEDIDRISNPNRPLFRADIDRHLYARTAPFFLVLSLSYATLAGFDYLFLMTVVIGNYYMYSMPPLRLKRVPVLSKAVIAVNSLGIIIAGYLVRNSSPRDLDFGLVAIILLGFTLASNFIDLKDYEGDKHEGIKTLPVLIGPRGAKLIIGLAFIAVYLSVHAVIPNKLLLAGLIVFGVVQFVLVNRRRYSELPVFVTHLVSIASLIAYIILFEPFYR